MVWATVFNVSIAAKGLSIFFFRDKKDFDHIFSDSYDIRYDWGILNNTASTKEQIKETNKAKKR